MIDGSLHDGVSQDGAYIDLEDIREEQTSNTSGKSCRKIEHLSVEAGKATEA